MKILLINPTLLDLNNRPVKYKKAFIPPLSLAILDSLTPEKHSVKIVNDIVENIDFNESFDLVGITAMTPQIKRAYQISDKFREKGIKVILGGVHPSILPDEAKEHSDAVVIGEAENIWEQIIDDVEAKRIKDQYQDTSLPDLKKLVIPKWDSMNISIYPKRIGAKFPIMPSYTGRGCPYNCKFCSVTKYFGKSYRTKPISNVLHEIDSINAKEILFMDDNIAFDADYCRELFKALSTRDKLWFSQASTTILNNPDLIDLAAKARCISLLIGIESIKKENLKSVNKTFNNPILYKELIQRMQRVDIVPHLSFIFGFDEDTPEQFIQTLEFIRENKIIYAHFWILTPFPGTELFEEMKKDERIETTDWARYDGTKVVYQPKNFSQQQLADLYWKSFQSVYTLSHCFKSISKTNIKKFFEGLFYLSYFRNKVNSFEHPYTGGIFRVKYTESMPGFI